MDAGTAIRKIIRHQFFLAVYFSVVTTFALFYDKIDGSQFMIIVGGIMAIFNHYDSKEKKDVG